MSEEPRSGPPRIDRARRALPGARLWPWFAVPLLAHVSLQAVHAALDRAPDFDEASYMAFARNILRTGTLISPAYPGQAFLAHPPLFYSLVTLSYWLFGPGLESGRLVSTLFSIGTLALVFWILAHQRGKGWAAAGTLLVGVNPVFLYYGHSVYMEMTVTFFMTAALAVILTADPEDARGGTELRAGILLGLACFTKYYAGVLVVVLALTVLFSGPVRRRTRRLAFLLGPVVASVLTWTLLGWWIGGRRFLAVNLIWLHADPLITMSSWRNVSNLVFARELVGVVTPAFAAVSTLGLLMAVTRTMRSREEAVHPALWIYPLVFLLFLMSFHEKDVKYVLPIVPALGVLSVSLPSLRFARRVSAGPRWAGALLFVALGSPLLPLYDPLTGEQHDNLWVFGIRRDAEYRLYQEAGRIAGRHSGSGDLVACERKCPIIGYYADRTFADLWGESLTTIESYFDKAAVVVLDRDTEYLTPEEQRELREWVLRDFAPVAALPTADDPRLEIFRRRDR